MLDDLRFLGELLSELVALHVGVQDAVGLDTALTLGECVADGEEGDHGGDCGHADGEDERGHASGPHTMCASGSWSRLYSSS